MARCWKCRQPAETGEIIEAVGLSGWYRTEKGGWARVIVNLGNPGYPLTVEVACHNCGLPSAEEEEARLQEAEASYQEWLA